jgi:hypothetical protein
MSLSQGLGLWNKELKAVGGSREANGAGTIERDERVAGV